MGLQKLFMGFVCILLPMIIYSRFLINDKLNGFIKLILLVVFGAISFVGFNFVQGM